MKTRLLCLSSILITSAFFSLPSSFCRSLLLLLLVLLGLNPAKAETPPASDDQILKWMKELKPLPKVHYSWPIPLNKISPELLHEYVRLTHAISLSGEWDKAEQVFHAVSICKKVNSEKPKTSASISFNFSVWHRRFGKETPPTDTGPEQVAELNFLKERLVKLKAGLEKANEKQKTNIEMTAILFDSERFNHKPDDKEWNQAITAKYDAATDIVHEVFPNVRIEWYGRGHIQPSASKSGWEQTRWFSLEEKADTLNCSLYQVPEIHNTREIFRRTAKNGEEHGCNEVTPWVALASGYRRLTENHHEWSYDWNYDLIYSWKLGAEINQEWYGTPERSQRFAPWNKAKVIIFYPEPFVRTPFWGEHFVAYVRGANAVKNLPGE